MIELSLESISYIQSMYIPSKWRCIHEAQLGLIAASIVMVESEPKFWQNVCWTGNATLTIGLCKDWFIKHSLNQIKFSFMTILNLHMKQGQQTS